MKALKIIYNIFIGCLIAVALLLVISVLPITGNFKILSVLSGSMEPTIHTGGIVAVKPKTSYRVGEIITFSQNSKTQISTTHRIVAAKLEAGKQIYITQGDANNAPDMKTIGQNEILGKVLFSVPYLGYAIDFAKKPLGFMLIVVIPAVVIIYDEIQKIKKEILKMKKKKAIKIKKLNQINEGLNKVLAKNIEDIKKI